MQKAIFAGVAAILLTEQPTEALELFGLGGRFGRAFGLFGRPRILPVIQLTKCERQALLWASGLEAECEEDEECLEEAESLK